METPAINSISALYNTFQDNLDVLRLVCVEHGANGKWTGIHLDIFPDGSGCIAFFDKTLANTVLALSSFTDFAGGIQAIQNLVKKYHERNG